MPRPRILDQKLMEKIARKIGKRDTAAVNSLVSRRASKLGISSEAALVLLAREHGIGTSTFHRRLDPAKQAEIRDSLPGLIAPIRPSNGTSNARGMRPTRSLINKRTSLKLTIEYLIEDPELRARCEDILLARGNFDRPVNQATLVLEDRIRKKAQPSKRLVGESLVGYAFNEDISKTVLEVASRDSDDQRGVTQILRGIVPAFRNKTHHHIINTFSREEAMRVCGFIDVLLRVVDNSTKIKP